jgi:diacylglycerol kinase family enzyme
MDVAASRPYYRDEPPDQPDPPVQTRPPRHLDLIVNAQCTGAYHARIVRDAQSYFLARGIHPHVNVAHSPEQLDAAIQRSAASDSAIVVAAGGDGTVSAVAASLVNTGKVLGVLPFGTSNYFARNAGVPFELDRALGAIAGGHTRPLTVGEVNGRIFVNDCSIGLSPAPPAQPESAHRGKGRSRLAAYVSAVAALARPPAHMNLEVQFENGGICCETSGLFVANNAYQLQALGACRPEGLDAGRLAMFIAQPAGVRQLWRQALTGMSKRLDDVPSLDTFCAADVVVTARRKSIPVELDGEFFHLESPLHYRIRSDALQVMVPSI